MLRAFVSRLAATVWPHRADADLQAEIDEHIECLAAGYIRQGLGPAEARLAARREFGGVEQVKEQYRDRRRFRIFEDLFRDFAFALRQMRKSPGFTIAAVTSLALGIGANTALFSFVNAILLKRLPVPSPQQLVILNHGQHAVMPLKQIDELARRNTVFDGLFGRYPIAVSLMTNDSPQWVWGELITGQYARALQLEPAVGRLLNEQDIRDAEGSPVCVISYRCWRDRFASDPAIVGKTIKLNMHAYKILGVSARNFAGTDLRQPGEVQIPMTRLGDFMPSFTAMKGFDWKSGLSLLYPMGRLKQGVTRVQAEEQMTLLARQVQSELHPNEARDSTRIQLSDGSQGFALAGTGFAKPSLVLLGVAGLVLLIACANLANLLLARTTARQSEFAVRLAMGGSRLRVFSQLLVESMVLAAFGCIAGIALAFALVRTVLLYRNQAGPALYALHVTPDATALAFAIGVSVACALLFGLAPAWQGSRTSIHDHGTARVTSGAFLRKALAAVQIALSVVVLFSAGLLTRSLRNLQTVDLGFTPDQIAAVAVNPASGGNQGADAGRVYDLLLERIRTLPGVKAASVALSTPMGDSVWTQSIKVPGYTSKAASDLIASTNVVGPHYFNVLGVPILEGRDFDARDRIDTQTTAIVNRHFADHYFGGRDVVGRYFYQGGAKTLIIGVAGNVRDQGVRNGQGDTFYRPSSQIMNSGLTLLVRCAGNCKPILPALTTAIQSVDRNTPVLSVHTLRTQIDGSLSSEHILGLLSTLFAGLATLLAGIGLYGVVSYGVVRRVREIGVRVAVGAQARDIARLFVGETAVIIALGMAAGIPAALASVKFLKTLLFGIDQHDPPTLIAAAACILLTAGLSTVLPIVRAMRVHPQQALRTE